MNTRIGLTTPQPTNQLTTPPKNPKSWGKLKTWLEIKCVSKLNTLNLSLVVPLDWSWTPKLFWTTTPPPPPPQFLKIFAMQDSLRPTKPSLPFFQNILTHKFLGPKICVDPKFRSHPIFFFTHNFFELQKWPKTPLIHKLFWDLETLKTPDISFVCLHWT